MQQQYIILCMFAVGSLLAFVLALLFRRYVAPWLDAKKQEIENMIGAQEYYRLSDLIRTLMVSAEVQIGDGNGKAKSELVISWIEKFFPGIDASYVQALIDGFMKGLAQEGLLHMK